MPLPAAVIAGRPNVGKSALFNALVGRRAAIVDPTPGVTRDVVALPMSCCGRRFLLVDTGGLGRTEDVLASEVRRKAGEALAAADLVVLVTDARTGVQDEDRRAARDLRRRGKPVLLVANKCDTPALDALAGAFVALGFGEAAPVSAAERRGTGELREAIAARLSAGPAETGPEEASALRIAVVGRRNAGKSTLVNALCGAERVLVDARPGTTRDAVEVPFRAKGGRFTAVDTAGFRREGRAGHPVEIYAAARAREALASSDVALLLLDASEPVTALDLHIAREIRDAAKPCVVVVNKWDLMGRIRTGEYQAHLEDRLGGLEYAPVVFVSAKGRRNLKGLVRLARALARQAAERVPTARLNRALEESLRAMPGPGGPRLPKVLFAAQVATRPPTLALTVSRPGDFPPAWRRALESRLRERLPFAEVPIRLLFRGRR